MLVPASELVETASAHRSAPRRAWALRESPAGSVLAVHNPVVARPCIQRFAARAVAAVVGASTVGCGGDEVQGSGGAAAASGSGTGGGGAGTGGAPPALSRPYAPEAAVNQTIPSDAEVDARSKAIVARLVANLATRPLRAHERADATPVYASAATDETWSVEVDGTAVTFRLPAGFEPGGEPARTLVVLDAGHPAYGGSTELALSGAAPDARTATLGAAASALLHYNDDGALLNPDATASVGAPFLGALPGAGLSPLVGLLRAEEIEAGTVAHALRLHYTACDMSADLRRPAVGTDQAGGCGAESGPAVSRMDMGMRLQLDAAVDCEARTVPGKDAGAPETRFLRVVCAALKRFGALVLAGSDTPDDVALVLEHAATASWSHAAGSSVDGDYGWVLRDQAASDGLTRGPSDGIPWSMLRVLAVSDFLAR